jgi:hypothetical protein
VALEGSFFRLGRIGGHMLKKGKRGVNSWLKTVSFLPVNQRYWQLRYQTPYDGYVPAGY